MRVDPERFWAWFRRTEASHVAWYIALTVMGLALAAEEDS